MTDPMRRLFAALLAATAPCAVAAQEVHPCIGNPVATAQAVEPHDANTRVFANGDVRLIHVDAGMPEAATRHLIVLSPPFSHGEAQCRVISREGAEGWATIGFSELEARYDPAIGLVFTVPARIVLPETGFQNPTRLTITVNQATGDVAVTQELGPE